jgi:signal transduction histidine kinase
MVSWAGFWAVIGVLIVGLGVSWQAASVLHDSRAAQTTELMDQRMALSRSAVDTEVHRHLDTLRLVAAALGGYEPLTFARFLTATATVADANLRGATTVVFIVPVADGQVAAQQRIWRERGAPALTLHPLGSREHLFTIFNRPLDGRPPATPGTDASQSAEPTAALNEARRSGIATVSDTYVLLRDRNLPAAQQQFSFILTAPVYGADRAFLGWVLMGLHGKDFIGATLHDVTQGVVDASLWATNGGGQTVRVASLNRQPHPDLFRSATITVANRAWRLDIAASSGHLPVSRNAGVVGLGGAVITLLLAGLVWVLATARARAEAKVSRATVDLLAAEREAQRQVALLNGILERISDGVGVVDQDGEFLIQNPAAKILMGRDEEIGGAHAWQEHFGIFHPDGTTPFQAEDLPLVRAMAGESTDDVEVVIRNANHPDGILLSVSSRPLDVDGQRGAISVFHDITAVREREADLRAFAGIVAHDLKNPLAVISAHAQMANDAVAELVLESTGPNGAHARESIDHVMGGVIRMRRLIDDLLAYTTARDAPLKVQAVDLYELFLDVVNARVSHLRPRPDIYVGPLPHVSADPVMLRHVVDNLVGNALKYVQPGRIPRIDISAFPAVDGWVRVEVADRGIGIPDEDKPHVFESFHRAHESSEYGGTGLGLAICRRVIDRHGGAITVADNPGGGSRFSFTLRVAAEAALVMVG